MYSIILEGLVEGGEGGEEEEKEEEEEEEEGERGGDDDLDYRWIVTSAVGKRLNPSFPIIYLFIF